MNSRRNFLRNALSFGAAVVALRAMGTTAAAAPSAAALAPDPHRILDLPPGFSYRVLSRTGDPMSDGLLEPGAHDGMACFPVAGDADRCLLVRNHEQYANESGQAGAFGRNHRDLAKVDPALIYDRTPQGWPFLGGTTTLLVNLKTGRVERSHLSLAGTERNCCGGPTPWGSWLSCEETITAPGDRASKHHGFVFEVPAAATGLSQPAPLTGLGRFVHEAAAVDPATGVVYLTEDSDRSLFYRFLPDAPGQLAKGGRLQALVLPEAPGAHTRNKDTVLFERRQRRPARWVDLDHVDSPDGDLPQRGHAKGAALFARGEGLAFALENGRAAIYFTCTSGGAAGRGQVFKYHPSRFEGRPEEKDEPGQLELFVESHGEQELDYPDNIAAAPWGDLVICEDGGGENWVRGARPDGRLYNIARNAFNGSEFAGACVSPDGATLFVNMQSPGMTLAITGPWASLSAAA